MLSWVHCAAMCGPLAAWQGKRPGRASSLRYLLGRGTAYAGLGGIAGGSGQALTAIAGPAAALLYSWSLSAALAVVAMRLWRGGSRTDATPAPIRIGRRRRPLAARLLSALRPGPFGVGALSALLPCGALWAAIATAAASGDAASGALAMIGFALVSSLGLLAGGWLGGRLIRGSLAGRRALAVFLVAGAVIAGLRPISVLAAAGEQPACHPAAHGAPR